MGMDVTLYFERFRDWWYLLGYKGTAEYRQMIHDQLKEHNEAMRNNTKSPYFDL